MKPSSLLVIGLGNNLPGINKYRTTKHNVGAETLVHFTEDFYAQSQLFRSSAAAQGVRGSTVREERSPHDNNSPNSTSTHHPERTVDDEPENPHPTWRDEHKLYRVASLARGRVRFLLPLTYMNESGKGVRAFLNHHHHRGNKDYFVDFLSSSSGGGRSLISSPRRVCVVHDELELPVGTCKIKTTTRSARGHNGVKSLIECLGTDEFVRLQIGVGRPVSRDPDKVAKYVLSDFPEEKMRGEVMEVAVRCLHDWLWGELSSSFLVSPRTSGLSE